MNEILEQDETKWIGLREALRQSQSLAVAGQFAATVMHEINNPLEAISNLNYLLQGDAHNPELVLRYSQQIDEQLAVLTRISRQTLSFYRPGEEKSPVAAAALAEAALRIHRKSIAEKRIHLDIRLANDVTMDVHPGEMLQVISNLISNAVDALPVEGSLYLRGRRRAAGFPFSSQMPAPAFPIQWSTRYSIPSSPPSGTKEQAWGSRFLKRLLRNIKARFEPGAAPSQGAPEPRFASRCHCRARQLQSDIALCAVLDIIQTKKRI